MNELQTDIIGRNGFYLQIRRAKIHVSKNQSAIFIRLCKNKISFVRSEIGFRNYVAPAKLKRLNTASENFTRLFERFFEFWKKRFEVCFNGGEIAG